MERRIIDEKSFPSNLEDRLASISNAINTELKIATLLQDICRRQRHLWHTEIHYMILRLLQKKLL